MSELKLDSRHTAVVVIDLQKGIVGRNCAPYPTSTVVANTQRLLAAARRARGSQQTGTTWQCALPSFPQTSMTQVVITKHESPAVCHFVIPAKEGIQKSRLPPLSQG